MPNLRVVAIDRDFRAEQVLGEARTDGDGRYQSPSSRLIPISSWGEQLVSVGHDVARVQQVILGQIADRAPVVVGGEHAVSERRLVQSLLDRAQGVSTLDSARSCGGGCSTCELAECNARGQAMGVPVHDEGRNDRSVPSGQNTQDTKA